ncbi:MAG: hypothetical protein WCG83_00085 [Candidatus Peregrinibacteria bacterium]
MTNESPENDRPHTSDDTVPSKPPSADRHQQNHSIRPHNYQSVFKRMYEEIDEELRRAFTELLSSMSLPFDLKGGLHQASDESTVFLRCVRSETVEGKVFHYYAGFIHDSFPASAAVIGIPWQIIDASTKKVIGEGTTEVCGHFGFRIKDSAVSEPKKLELRFGQQQSAIEQSASPPSV